MNFQMHRFLKETKTRKGKRAQKESVFQQTQSSNAHSHSSGHPHTIRMLNLD